MKVEELIKVMSKFSPDANVEVVYGRMIHPIVFADASIDMDTNKANVVLFVDEFRTHSKEE